jgi:hypothetical protein
MGGRSNPATRSATVVKYGKFRPRPQPKSRTDETPAGSATVGTYGVNGLPDDVPVRIHSRTSSSVPVSATRSQSSSAITARLGSAWSGNHIQPAPAGRNRKLSRLESRLRL